MRALLPSLSKNTPLRWNRVSSLQTENSVRSIISAQHRALDRRVLRLAMVGNLREVAVGHADDAIGDLPRANLRPVVVRLLERDVVAWSVRDELVEVLGAERDAAFLRVLALELRGQRDVEVGRCDEDLVLALRAKQDVGEHRHRALAVGDALREPQAAKKLVLCDSKLHGHRLALLSLFFVLFFRSLRIKSS